MSIQNRIFKKTADFSFFQIYIDTKTGNILDDFKDVLTADEIKKLDKNKNIRIKNNDSIITIDNWSELKDIFFSQRMETYNSSYTPNEKIKLELEALEKLPINKTDYKILKERYQKYLTNIKPQQLQDIKPDEIKKELYNNIFKDNSIYLFEKYFENKSMTFQSRTDFRFLFEQMKKDSLIHDTVTLGQYIKFIGKYGYYETELKAIELDALKNIQRTKDYNEYKDNLKTTLK
tara:strand:- start:78 stop:776 length:699 start_codon:yes stop_codon:yes gene_type:complete